MVSKLAGARLSVRCLLRFFSSAYDNFNLKRVLVIESGETETNPVLKRFFFMEFF